MAGGNFGVCTNISAVAGKLRRFVLINAGFVF